MENRRPAPGDAAGKGRARRARWLLLAGAVLVIALILVSAARLSAPGAADPWRSRGGQTVVQPDPPAQEAATEAIPRPALIIDAPPARPALQESPLALIQPQAPPAAASDPPGGEQPLQSSAPAATADFPRAPAPPQARSAAASPTVDANDSLLSTLLGIIRQGEPQPGQAQGAAPTAVQRELQACPAANTVQGIHCRDRICARWAGLDPACPAR